MSEAKQWLEQIAAYPKSTTQEQITEAAEAGVARIEALEAENRRMREALTYAVKKYGKPGGPWNVPSEPGSWITKARAALEGEKP